MMNGTAQVDLQELAPELVQKLKNCVAALTYAVDGWDEADPMLAKMRATRDGAAQTVAKAEGK